MSYFLPKNRRHVPCLRDTDTSMKWLWIICPPVHHWQLQPRFVFLNKTSFYLRGLGSASISEECPGRLKCVYGQNTRRGQHAEHEEDGAGAGVRYAASCSCSGLLARPPSLLLRALPRRSPYINRRRSGGRDVRVREGRGRGGQAMGNARSKGARSLDPHLPILAPPSVLFLHALTAQGAGRASSSTHADNDQL